MKRLLILGALVVAAVIIAAVVAIAASGGGGGDEPSSAEPTTGSATVSAQQLGDMGDVLVDSQGRALYAADQETAAGKVLCTEGCTSFWEPLTMSGGAPTADSVSGELAVVERPTARGRSRSPASSSTRSWRTSPARSPATASRTPSTARPSRGASSTPTAARIPRRVETTQAAGSVTDARAAPRRPCLGRRGGGAAQGGRTTGSGEGGSRGASLAWTRVSGWTPWRGSCSCGGSRSRFCDARSRSDSTPSATGGTSGGRGPATRPATRMRAT